jgi:hypothetical protein
MTYAPRPRAMGEIIGRQPATIYVTPSKAPSCWYGSIRGGVKTGFGGHSVTGGDRFTVEQVRALISRGIDVLTAPAMKVQRNAADHEIYSGLGLPAVYQFECPILSTRADGRVRVIAPNGAEKLVEADGWTTAQRSRAHTRRAAA